MRSRLKRLLVLFMAILMCIPTGITGWAAPTSSVFSTSADSMTEQYKVYFRDIKGNYKVLSMKYKDGKLSNGMSTLKINTTTGAAEASIFDISINPLSGEKGARAQYLANQSEIDSLRTWEDIQARTYRNIVRVLAANIKASNPADYENFVFSVVPNLVNETYKHGGLSITVDNVTALCNVSQAKMNDPENGTQLAAALLSVCDATSNDDTEDAVVKDFNNAGKAVTTDKESKRKVAISELAGLLKSGGNTTVADSKEEASSAGSSTADNSDSDEAYAKEYGFTKTEWNNWYIAAWKIATDVDTSSENWKLDDAYKDAHNMIGKAESAENKEGFWKKVYSVCAIAYSYKSSSVNDWDSNAEVLTWAYGNISSYNGYVLPGGMTQYAAIVNDLTNLEASAPTDWIKRAQSFKIRLEALYHMSTLENVNMDSDDNYAWVKNYYTDNTDSMRMPDAVFPTEDNIDDFLAFNGEAMDGSKSIIEGFPKFAGNSGNAKVMTYFMRTLWEMPYITYYMSNDLSDAIKNSTVSEHQQIYLGLKAIKESVDEFGMPFMEKLWELESPDATGDYKSLKALWEKCQEDPTLAEAQTEQTKDLTNGKPLSAFFEDYSAGKLSESYIKAIAYTSSLSPMQSNVYSKQWRSVLDDDLKKEFYDLWGFNRKALFRDKTTDAGAEYYTSGKESKGDLEVCTLRDFIDSNGDIVLYLDDNFYNASKLKSDNLISPSYTTAENEQQPGADIWYGNLSKSIEDSYNTSFDNIVKNGPNTNYSKVFYKMMDKVSGSHTYYPEATETNEGNTDNMVLSSGKINYYLNPGDTGSETYSPLQAYAVVSTVYRDGNLFDLTGKKENQRPVFISSKSAAYAKNATDEQKMTIFNYALARNIKAAMPVGYVGNLDMDCPLYMDILGDIVTESGTVVVPAMSNATIMSHNSYYKSMWSAGLFNVYGLDYKIPVKSKDSETIGPVIDGIFEPDADGKYYLPVARTLGDDYSIDMSRLTTSSQSTIQILFERAYADMMNTKDTDDPLYDFHSYLQICLEVLRGAPIENIDKEAEGISTDSRTDRAGIVAAAKLEELNKSLGTDGENTTIALPNIAFMQGFNYVALIVFKLLLLAVLVVNMLTVYYDAVSESLNIGTFGKCLWSMVITMATVVTVPAVFNVTYYQANRALLQDESSYVSMLNMEKEESGVEIGVTSIDDPEIKTTLYLKLEDIKIPWYDLFYNSVHTDSYKTLNNMYENYAKEHSEIAYRDDVDIKNDGVYANVNTIYKSSSVDIDTRSSDPNRVNLVQTAEANTQTFSFYSPYYTILDALIRNVNYFNAHPWGDDDNSSSQGWYSYQTKTQRGGKLKTMGIIEPYLSSSRFMEEDSRDPLGLKAVYSEMMTSDYLPDDATVGLFNEQNIQSMKNAYWYPTGMSAVEVSKRVKYLDDEARSFVAKNKDLIGKISDETFLKVMAMDLAVKHNRIFGCNYASAYEIENLSSDDLVRLSIAERGDVVLNSALSYPRFVYAVGGTPAVFAAAMLSMILWVSGIVKPILVIVAFVTIFVSIFIFKICMRKSNVSLYGYVMTTLLLCLTNVLYAVLLKLSIYLPTVGMTPLMCIIIQIIVQIVYLVMLLSVVWTAFKDWRDLGFARYSEKLRDMKVSMSSMLHKGKGHGNPNFEGSNRLSDPDKNWNYFDHMLDERERRGK